MTVSSGRNNKADLSLDDAISEYVLAYRVEAKSPKTIAWYEQKLRHFERHLTSSGLPELLGGIDTAILRTFVGHLRTDIQADASHPLKPSRNEHLSAHTVQGYIRTLRAFFAWAVREGLLPESPMAGIWAHKVPSLIMRPFSEPEVRQILAGCERKTVLGIRDYTSLVLLSDTGIRASELIGLRLGDVDWAQGYVKVFGKGRKERIVPLGYTAHSTLGQYVRRFRPEPALPTLDQVFLTGQGCPLKIDWHYKIVASACKRAGIHGRRLGPHTFRHTFARSTLMDGGDLLTLKRILGHSNLDVVRLYVNLDATELLNQQRKYSMVDTLYKKGTP